MGLGDRLVPVEDQQLPGRLAAALLAALALWALAIGGAQATHNSGAAAPAARELLIFDWNKPVTKAHSGFPWFLPPPQNGNWKSPVNYAEGTYHIRVQVSKAAQAAEHAHPVLPVAGQSEARELQHVRHGQGHARHRRHLVAAGGEDVEEERQGDRLCRLRQRIGAAIWNGKLPVSAYGGFKWAGENPDQWYPLDMRMTIVAVAKGATFGGWRSCTSSESRAEASAE